MDRDASTRAQLEQHWQASDRGDTETENAIYAADAILDYPQSDPCHPPAVPAGCTGGPR
jgi:hypothetical protein